MRIASSVHSVLIFFFFELIAHYCVLDSRSGLDGLLIIGECFNELQRLRCTTISLNYPRPFRSYLPSFPPFLLQMVSTQGAQAWTSTNVRVLQ
jgi:hypothetical protein